MPQFSTRRRVRHSAADMFDLVADVERYPEFVPLCRAMRVLRRAKTGDREVVVAEMTVAYKLIKETFTSRVTLDRARLQILVEYLDGPFSRMENQWHFHAAPSCRRRDPATSNSSSPMNSRAAPSAFSWARCSMRRSAVSPRPSSTVPTWCSAAPARRSARAASPRQILQHGERLRHRAQPHGGAADVAEPAVRDG